MTTDWLCWDDFQDDRPDGGVIGTRSSSGHRRLGLDAEGVFSIDHGALRVAPIVEAGFGRAALAYGPFEARPGLAFAVHLLNGHNTAQAEPLPVTFAQRMASWARGAETEPVVDRLGRWARSGRVRRTLRQFGWWRRVGKGGRPVPLLDENLAVGWFGDEVVPDPRKEGSAFVMHALGPDNGELWVGPPAARSRPLRAVRNLPLYLVAVLREGGVVYYASSIEGAHGLPAFPGFRAVAVDRSALAGELYLGFQQSVLGQIGFRVDSRLQAVRVTHLDGYDAWHGGATAADELVGRGELAGRPAQEGGAWTTPSGSVRRSGDGATGAGIAILSPAEPTGMIHAVVRPGAGPSSGAGLAWRFRDERHHWRLELRRDRCELALVDGGARTVLASTEPDPAPASGEHRLMVLDDGARVMAYLDGASLSEGWVTDGRFREEAGVGFLVEDEGGETGIVRSFEAHPRRVELAGGFGLDPSGLRSGTRTVVADDFSGRRGAMEGRRTSSGDRRWRRLLGDGRIAVDGQGAARVEAGLGRPCPGRTAYTVGWDDPEFAELEVVVTPPGTDTGQGHKCTGGFIFYQDRDTYVTLNLFMSDWYPAASVSTFFKFDGFEDVYDAVWCNIGRLAFHGRPARLTMACDGESYLVHVDGEAVLFRSFSDVYPDFERLAIREVGILANWEFGNDTGTRFQDFEARR